MWDFKNFFALDSFRQPWMRSHAQLPTPLVLSQDTVRIFFASRDERQYSSIGFVDLYFEGESARIVNVSEEPVLSPGPIGHFDEHGIFPSCVVRDGDVWLMFFIGWNRGHEAPLFYASIGIAESKDGMHFRRTSPAPVLSRSDFDPCLVTSPHVLNIDNRWLMTYVSGIAWSRDDKGRLQSRYHIKLAEGVSPREFIRTGHVAIDLREGETNVARSSVVPLGNGRLGMWFSYVHRDIGKYRLGYAESRDWVHWTRDDERCGVSSLPDFGRQMLCYPSVFDLGPARWMVVNGDNFGAEGFGLGVWRGSQRVD